MWKANSREHLYLTIQIAYVGPSSPLRIPLQNISYLSTFSNLWDTRAGKFLSASISFDPCNIPTACLVPPRSRWNHQLHAPPWSQYFPHSAYLLTWQLLLWAFLLNSTLIATFSELLFPIVDLAPFSWGLWHILLPQYLSLTLVTPIQYLCSQL